MMTLTSIFFPSAPWHIGVKQSIDEGDHGRGGQMGDILFKKRSNISTVFWD
ncbi:MAG: hypothetical protein LBB80_00780 [Treponema sp.]|jgi:hypothetical protein|nr:hypothetical protein [Treponema sp.]